MKYDVIIIGAGPAGLSCALELQQTQKKILLLEKNREIGPKVCAGGLTTKIETMGLSLDIADVLFQSIVINVSGREKKIYSDRPFVATIDREKLGNLLLNRVSDSIEVRTNTTVREIEGNHVHTDGNTFMFKYLVGADGSNSVVRRHIGLETEKTLVALQYRIPGKRSNLELHFNASLFSSGYGWIFPHKDYTSIGCCCQNGTFKDNNMLLRNFTTWLREKKIAVGNTKLEGSVINFDYQGYDFGNIFLAGDAGGFASGLTGEGMFFAMVSGQEVARKIIDPAYNCPNIDEIVHIKRIHERALAVISSLGSVSTRFCYNLLPLLFTSRRFKKFALATFS